MSVTIEVEAGFLEVTTTRKMNGVTWYADANIECWWNFEMTACIVKHHSRRYNLCDGNMDIKSYHSSFKEAAEGV